MKLDVISPAIIRQLNPEIQAALAPIAEKYGLAISVGGGRYTPGSFSPKVQLSVMRNGHAESPEAQAFRQFCGFDGLTPEHLGKTFHQFGRSFTLTGFRSKAPKRPYLATDSEGKVYVFPAEAIRTAFDITKPRGV